ncbi:chemotaxis protein CheB [Psychrobacter frigidicola]|uniref:protein-glutamate methylesterase n=1 Tax=Psychrobacter frigidicola TaxID=45611 RepID=A0A5C6ZZ70_9GAMM|nr:chemotaxis protein CheB [Psychrobacter frigidicola]TXD96401.1 chemotaxis protein CheB [Psychrobacter frigidicola]
MTDNTRLALLQDKDSRDITVLVVAESQHQRLAFSETVRSCGFTLVDSVSRAQLQHQRQQPQVDIWLVDSDYDDHVATAIAASYSSAVLVGFSQAPYLNEAQHYGKWQRKLKRKLAHILSMPALMASPTYHRRAEPWRLVVLLGASMGGPSAVKAFLDNLSPTLPICILLAHHFNQSMLETLPRILNRHNEWGCQVISTTQSLQSGHCLIVPIDRQIVCDSEGRVILLENAWTGDYKPAIGQLLKNASDVYGSELVSIIFSGMGCDGSQYLGTIQDNHSQLWAQDPSISTCPSQPQAIIDSGYCNFIGSPEALAQKLTDYVNKMSTDFSEP